MIWLHRLGGEELVINAELIEMIESTPDTVITLITGRKHLVREDADEVVRLALEYRRQAYGERAIVAPPPARAPKEETSS